MKAIRQGDVLLLCGAEVPSAAKSLDHLVLAEGEVTGHAHRITSGVAELLECGERKFLRVDEPAELTHEEHGPHTLEPGSYEIRIQREYEPEGWRNVAD